MHKLIIMIEAPEDSLAFEEAWPEFLHHAEQLPRLVREATVRVNRILFGNTQIRTIHELFFNTQEGLHNAMASPQGQLTGQILQKITEGRMLLMTAEHREDDIENIRRYQSIGPDVDAQ